MVLGLPYGELPEVKYRRRQHRGRVALPDAVDQVIEIAHAAGRDHRNPDAVGHGLGQRQVEPLPRAGKLAGAIAGRALYDGRLDPAAALALIRSARAA